MINFVQGDGSTPQTYSYDEVLENFKRGDSFTNVINADKDGLCTDTPQVYILMIDEVGKKKLVCLSTGITMSRGYRGRYRKADFVIKEIKPVTS